MYASRIAIAVIAATAMGCGGDDPPPPDAGVTAADYEGMWLMTSITLPGSQGGPPTTLHRTGGDQNLRGDIVFTPTSATTGTLSVRQAVLLGNMMAGDMMSMIVAVTVEPDRWLLSLPDGQTAVFTTARTGDHLELSVDAGDPRHDATDPPSSIVVDRAPPWSTTVVGAWQLVSMQLPDRTVVAGACTEIQPGTAWAKVEMPIAFTPRLLFERRMIVAIYGDAQCATPTGTQTSVQTGFAEEEDATTLRIWGTEDGRSEFQVFAMAVAGDTATLTRTACLPLPACEDEAPTTVVVRRAP